MLLYSFANYSWLLHDYKDMQAHEHKHLRVQGIDNCTAFKRSVTLHEQTLIPWTAALALLWKGIPETSFLRPSLNPSIEP